MVLKPRESVVVYETIAIGKDGANRLGHSVMSGIVGLNDWVDWNGTKTGVRNTETTTWAVPAVFRQRWESVSAPLATSNRQLYKRQRQLIHLARAARVTGPGSGVDTLWQLSGRQCMMRKPKLLARANNALRWLVEGIVHWLYLCCHDIDIVTLVYFFWRSCLYKYPK